MRKLVDVGAAIEPPQKFTHSVNRFLLTAGVHLVALNEQRRGRSDDAVAGLFDDDAPRRWGGRGRRVRMRRLVDTRLASGGPNQLAAEGSLVVGDKDGWSGSLVGL